MMSTLATPLENVLGSAYVSASFVPLFDNHTQIEMNMLRGYAVAAACLAATVATAAAFTTGGEW